MNFTPKLRAALLIAAAALGAGAVHAAVPSRVADLHAATRPAGVPLDYVVTPNGFFHASCVIELADDDLIATSGEITHADGRVSKATHCAFPAFGTDGHPLGAAADTAPPPTINGWLVNSNSGAVPAAKNIADFVVPSAPISSTGQVLYYFPGLEALQNTQSILQPVLAWNGFGDNAWSVTNWNCCIDGTTFHGGTIAASTGDKIHGVMKGTKCDSSTGVCANWQITSTNKRTKQKTAFKTQAHDQAMNWYFAAVMEVYGVDTCSQFPANGSITFSNVHFYDLNQHEVTGGGWSQSVGNATPSCGYGISINTGAATWVITFNPHA